MRWEYNSVCFEYDHDRTMYMEDKVYELLDEYGEDGWELVSTSDIGYPMGSNKQLLFIFKRPIGSSQNS